MAKICVFLSAYESADRDISDSVALLGKQMAAHRHTLIYGGSSIGLMGLLADTVLASNGKVIGVTTQFLQDKELKHQTLTELRIVETMQQRKYLLAQEAECFVIMPGGLGTLEELFEVWNAAKIGEHHKPIKLLNLNGFFDGLFNFLNKCIQTGFLREEHLKKVEVYDNMTALLQSLPD